MKLYLSGPMTGLPDHNRPEFNAAAAQLREAGFEVWSPAELEIGDGLPYASYLRADLRGLLRCDGVAALENWWASKGARLEVNVAGHLEMPVRTLQDWLSRAYRPRVVPLHWDAIERGEAYG